MQDGEATYNAWEEDFATLNIFFGQETVMREISLNYAQFMSVRIILANLLLDMERDISMGPVEFVSSLGGLFGLFLGFSAVSFLEIVYWATVRMGRNLFGRNNV